MEHVASGPLRTDLRTNRISAPIQDRTQALITVATALAEAQIEPEDLSLRRPTLDEVFIHLTGQAETDQVLEVMQ
jgi:ABC-2 type transport system ATP-binding protein